MNRNVSQTARVLGKETEQVKKWAYLFKEYLSARANPLIGQAREFSDSDLLVLAFVCEHWEAGSDLVAIKIGLNEEAYLDEKFFELLYLNSPILQEPPEGLDETWRHGVLLIGGHGQDRFELARNYRHVAKTMLEQALKNGDARDWICPVLFAYRHTLELYLKELGNISQRTHSLAECVILVEKLHGAKLNPQVKRWIEELDYIDPKGEFFRYQDEEKQRDCAEYWVDLCQFKFAMGKVFEMIDMAVLATM